MHGDFRNWQTNPIHKCTGKQHETKDDERGIIYLSVNKKIRSQIN